MDSTEEAHRVAASDNKSVVIDQILVDLVDYLYHYEITSIHALETARFALLDALGCAMETLNSAECPNFIGPLVPGCVVHNGFRLPGTSYELDPMKGAFDMGALIRYLDHNDGFTGAEWGHPSDNIGAILATADWLSRNPSAASATAPSATLHTVIIAMVKAYEIQGCFQISNAFNAVGLDHVILVKVASTAVAWMDGQPLRTYRHAPNTGPRKGWAGGDAYMRAVHLVLLTRSDPSGASTVLSASRWGFYDALFRGKEFELSRKYGTYVMENIFFKPAPVEAHALSAMEAILKLRPVVLKHGNMNDMASIIVRTHAGACLIINKSGELHNAADRDHCIQYILVVALLKGQRLEYSDYSDQGPWASDPRVAKIREKIELLEDKQFTLDYHDPVKRSLASGVRVVFNDGTESEEEIVEHPLGNRHNPETWHLLQQKISRSLSGMFETERVERIVADVHGNEDMPIRDFVDLLWKRPC
ncbi:hypothetical protein MMC27_006802 [Xylographa pallens]|nr:hypothetical protein [Xylographa pallens]